MFPKWNFEHDDYPCVAEKGWQSEIIQIKAEDGGERLWRRNAIVLYINPRVLFVVLMNEMGFTDLVHLIQPHLGPLT